MTAASSLFAMAPRPESFVRGTETVQAVVFSWLYENGPDRGTTRGEFCPYFTLMRSPIAFVPTPISSWCRGGRGGTTSRCWQTTIRYTRAGWRNIVRCAGRPPRQVASASMDNITLAVTINAYPLHFDHSLNAVLRAYGLA